MKTTSRILVCLLGAIFIFSSLGAVYAVDPSPEPSPTPTVPPDYYPDSRVNLQLEMVSYYIYLMLNSWGIDVQFNNISSFTDDVKNWIIDIMLDYCVDVGITAAQWIAPWLFNFDFWGNLTANDRALNDIQNFAQWLSNKYNLTDNSIIVIDPVYSAGGYTVYNTDTWYKVVDYNGNDSQYFKLAEVTNSTNNASDIIGYALAEITYNNLSHSLYFIPLSATNFRYSFGFKVVDMTNQEDSLGGGTISSSQWKISSHNVFYYSLTFAGWGQLQNEYTLPGTNLQFTNDDDLADWLEDVQVVQEGNIKVVTSTKVLPYQDPDYTDGDSITIIGGQPSYSIIEWDGSVTVENLPAIVSTGSIPTPGDDLNPGLVNAWHPISTLIEMTADSMGMLIGIVYEFPEEVIIPIFAVLGGIIIFGIIYAMKEH